MIKLLNLDRQYYSIKGEIDGAIARVIESGEFMGGMRDNPFVREFEEEFAAYVGVRHCIGVGSGTDAIEIVLKAISRYHYEKGIPAPLAITGVPANTAYPVAEAVLKTGFHHPVFIDCDPVTYTAIPVTGCGYFIACHQYGHPCAMDDVMEMADEHGFFLLEDCSHAHGAKYHGRNVGTFGDAAVFSFNPVKILGAMGDAGCIVTNDDGLAQVCRQLADHGRREKYTHGYIGWNSRLDGLQAAILSVKLRHLDEWVEKRNQIAMKYHTALFDVSTGADYPIATIPPYHIRHAYHQFVIRVPNRDKVREGLYDKGVETGIHYPLSLPEQPALRYLGVDPDGFVATKLGREILSLPINESMTDDEVSMVCDVLAEALNG